MQISSIPSGRGPISSYATRIDNHRELTINSFVHWKSVSMCRISRNARFYFLLHSRYEWWWVFSFLFYLLLFRRPLSFSSCRSCFFPSLSIMILSVFRLTKNPEEEDVFFRCCCSGDAMWASFFLAESNAMFFPCRWCVRDVRQGPGNLCTHTHTAVGNGIFLFHIPLGIFFTAHDYDK